LLRRRKFFHCGRVLAGASAKRRGTDASGREGSQGTPQARRRAKGRHQL
jgi:hypothetical protein